MVLCTECAILRNEWLAAINETLYAVHLNDQHAIQTARLNADQAFERYLRAQRECSVCKADEPLRS